MEVCKSKVYLEKRDWSFGHWEQKMQTLKLFPSSLLVWRGGGKIWSGGNRMKSQDRRSLNQSGLKALSDLGDYGLNMLTRSWYRVLVLGCWKTTVLNKWQGQNCKEVKADFGNLLPRPLTSPLHPGRSPRASLRSPRSRERLVCWERLCLFSRLKGLRLAPTFITPRQTAISESESETFCIHLCEGASKMGLGKRVPRIEPANKNRAEEPARSTWRVCRLPVTERS